MAYTLADYQRISGTNGLKAGIVETFRETSAIMEALSWADEGTLNLEILRTKTLPTIGTRKIGGTFSESKGTTDSVQSRIVNLGAYFDIDKVIMKAKSQVDQKALQIKLFSQAFAKKFDNTLINGQPSTDYDDLTGIRYMLINLLSSAQTVAAGGLDVSPDSAGLAANIKTLIDHLHEVIDLAMQPDFLIMNREMKMRLNSALRQSGLLSTTQDSFGRKFETFGEGGPKLLDIGTTDPLDRTTRIIGNVELDDGSAITGGDATSIYALKIGDEYFNGWQEYGLDINDIGYLENGVSYRVVVDWTPGIYVVHPYSLARIVGVVAA